MRMKKYHPRVFRNKSDKNTRQIKVNFVFSTFMKTQANKKWNNYFKEKKI